MTFGKLSLGEGRSKWVIEALAPHVAIKFKRLFPKVSASAHKCVLTASAETCDELRWFLDRYPLEVTPKHWAELNRRADEHVTRQQRVLALLSGDAPASPALTMAEPARAYQEVIAELAQTTGRVLCGDELGLGKTVSAIALLAREGRLPAVVIGPTHLPNQWRAALERFLPQVSVHVAATASPDRERKRANLKADVLVIPYSRIHGWVDFVRPATVVFDEIHELRHSGTIRYSAAMAISMKAPVRIGLSATPIFNYGGEFFNVIQILAPDELGTWDEFRIEWCGGATREGKEAIKDPIAFGSYLRQLGLFVRRTRREVGRQLPPIVRTVIDVEASDPTETERDTLAELAQRVLSGQRKVSFTAAGELNAFARKVTGLAKARTVAALVEELLETSGEPIVLFGWHHEVYDVWTRALARFNPVLYTGHQDGKAKDAAIAKFIAGESKVLIMSLRAGQGVDGLQGHCHRVVHGELDWSPHVHDQCTGRIHRDGQTEPTMVYYCVCDVGADPIMLDVLDVKRGQSDPVVDPGGERVLATTADPEHVKRLAEDILRRREGAGA